MPHVPQHHRSTRVVKAGRPAATPDSPLNVPLTMASTYVAGGEIEYGRYGNPTWAAFEQALGELEGGECIAFASGLAAVDAVLDLVGPGERVVAPRHAYQGVTMQLADLEARGRLRATLVDITDVDGVITACDDAALLWLESPTNPALEVIDLDRVIPAAHEKGLRVVVDNTFATPILQNPLAHGADLVVHSATKFIAGHSDAVLGAVITAEPEVRDALRERRDLTGGIPGTLEAWLALRGLRTLHLRVDRSQENARVLAERLATHQKVTEVRYPGFGGVVSVVLADAPAADRFVDHVALWVHATSLGGVESTLERRRRWASEPRTIPEGLVRLSVGIEDVEDLWEDLHQALDK